MALALVARLEMDSAPDLGHAFLTLARGDTLQAATTLAESMERLPAAASLLLYTAAQWRRAARAEGPATELFKRVVEEYATSAEAPAAELEWARSLRRSGNALEAARRLEHLILTYPQSALVPQARRDLEVVRGSIP